MGTEACSLPLAHGYPEFLKASQSKPVPVVPGVCIAPWMPEAAGKETEAWVLAQSLVDQQASVG